METELKPFSLLSRKSTDSGFRPIDRAAPRRAVRSVLALLSDKDNCRDPDRLRLTLTQNPGQTSHTWYRKL